MKSAVMPGLLSSLILMLVSLAVQPGCEPGIPETPPLYSELTVWLGTYSSSGGSLTGSFDHSAYDMTGDIECAALETADAAVDTFVDINAAGPGLAFDGKYFWYIFNTSYFETRIYKLRAE